MGVWKKKAKKLSKELRKELKQAARDIQKKLDRGELVTIDEIKEWRRDWIGKALVIREIARDAKEAGDEDERDDVKDIAINFEDKVRDYEENLIDDAEEMEEAQERGGVKTHQERAKEAFKEGKKSRGISCPSCGVAIPDSETQICAYCGASLKGEGTKISTGWVSFQKGGKVDLATPQEVYDATTAHIKALEDAYKAQLEYERQGLFMVLAAGKRRTDEFNNAAEDAYVRLGKIWDKIREVGQEAERKLSGMGAVKKENKIGKLYDNTCERVDYLKETVMRGVEREASLAWDRQQKGGEVRITCTHCGADLKVENPSVAGEVTCEHCEGLNKYSPQLDEHEISLNKKIDEQMTTNRPVEEQFRYMQQRCLSDPSEENMQNLESAAHAMYDKQLFYIKDELKRNNAVARYVSQAMKEAQSVK